jgi:hypothetical protein
MTTCFESCLENGTIAGTIPTDLFARLAQNLVELGKRVGLQGRRNRDDDYLEHKHSNRKPCLGDFSQKVDADGVEWEGPIWPFAHVNQDRLQSEDTESSQGRVACPESSFE